MRFNHSLMLTLLLALIAMVAASGPPERRKEGCGLGEVYDQSGARFTMKRDGVCYQVSTL
jgi:hypothetical protein